MKGALNRILFIRTDRLGETLLNLPAIAALHAARPEAAITLLVHPDVQPLLKEIPGIAEVWTHAPGPRAWWWLRAWRLARRLRRAGFDLAIISNPMKELHLAVWLAGIPARVGYARKWGRLLTHRVPDGKALGQRHEVEYNLELLRAVGMPTAVPAWWLPRRPADEEAVARVLAQRGIAAADSVLVIHPWSSNPVKEWPLDRYHQVVRQLASQGARRMVVIGGPEERLRARAVAGWPVVDFVGQLTLPQLAALLRRATLMLSNDSGPVHVAAAVGTPTVTLFGTVEAATGPQRWGPWGQGHAVIWKPSMEAIGVEEVVRAVQEQWDADAGR